ncbi:MAG TPA: translocation/assembly module TamB domain-containing protein, partial [Vineibacter sp.]|nr:translocation/assembly module TamB domain-containing protein [Vineibacter sp.]
NIASSLLTASGRGRLAADGAVAANATIDVPDVSLLNAVVQWPIAGSARFNASLSGTRDKPAVTLESTMRDAAVATVPQALIAPVVTATVSGSLDRQGAWRLEKATVTSDAMSVQASGAGRHSDGKLDVAFTLPKLEALDPHAAGRLSGDIRVAITGDQRTVRLKAQLAEARVDQAAIEHLGLDANIVLRQDGFDATLDMDGASGEQPLRAHGRVMATAGERLLIPSLEASLGTTSLSIRDLAVDRTSATGSARLVVEDLKQLGALAHQQTAGRLEVTVVPDPEANGSQLKITMRGSDLAFQDTAIGALDGDATLADPLGRAAFDASLSAKGLRGLDDFRTLALKAAGDRTALTATVDLSGTSTSASSTLRARFEDTGTVVDIEALKGTRAGRPFALAQPGRLRYAGGRMVVEPLRLTVAGGQVRVAGVVDVRDSDLAIDLAALSLADLAGLAGVDQPLSGTLQAQLRVRGDAANPRIEATYAVRDARLRRIETASVPAIALTGKAAVANRDLTAEAQLAVGGGNVALSVSARLPAQVGMPDGRIKLTGPLDLAIFASLLGPDIQQVGGRAVLDVTISERAGRLAGTGTVRLEGLALALPSEGLVLSQGTGLIRLADDKIVIERLAFPAVGKGDIAMSGEVRLDRTLSWPLDLRFETRNARLVNRRDLVAELTSTLRLSGSAAEGLSLQGPIRIERAAINAAIGGVSKAVPAVPVREVGAGAPKRVKAPAPTKPLALDLKVSAPQAVFVRGKGLDAELGGEFAVAGTTANPTVIGGLQMRRGTYTLLGRSLGFARSSVTFTSVDRIVPLLDLLATTRSGGIAIEVSVRGQASDPKIVLSSTPQLPQDEIMAQFLFGKGSAELGPSQLVEVAEALAELTGTASSAAALETLRKALGLDRLGIARGGQAGGNGLAGSGIEGGRYIGQGIYVGGRQGLQGDSRGVVQIEVIPHVKLEAEVGTKSTGRAGIALEYDY